MITLLFWFLLWCIHTAAAVVAAFINYSCSLNDSHWQFLFAVTNCNVICSCCNASLLLFQFLLMLLLLLLITLTASMVVTSCSQYSAAVNLMKLFCHRYFECCHCCRWCCCCFHSISHYKFLLLLYSCFCYYSFFAAVLLLLITLATSMIFVNS